MKKLIVVLLILFISFIIINGRISFSLSADPGGVTEVQPPNPTPNEGI